MVHRDRTESYYGTAGCMRGIARVSHPIGERPGPHTEDPAMNEHITHVAFDMYQASITAAWLSLGAGTPPRYLVPDGV
jgi:hypothetical protein